MRERTLKENDYKFGYIHKSPNRTATVKPVNEGVWKELRMGNKMSTFSVRTCKKNFRSLKANALRMNDTGLLQLTIQGFNIGFNFQQLRKTDDPGKMSFATDRHHLQEEDKKLAEKKTRMAHRVARWVSLVMRDTQSKAKA